MLWWVLGIIIAVIFIAWIVCALINAPLFDDNDLFDGLIAEDELKKQPESKNDDER